MCTCAVFNGPSAAERATLRADVSCTGTLTYYLRPSTLQAPTSSHTIDVSPFLT